ncbi:MAG: LemA family protein, LemA protein [Candidatus Woesebacteria bacterium GW2011_GWC1_38_13]|uniref:LemA family protein, LemA protein n=1 Tax=Candidatus Woesebacteria bacterium GW2011_GWC1_38_13 TaxID=1618583 RepID=A0A0G0L5K9_9BACT|nr:MAG: LemA family protein, LemA protein [Candidatus Woesebacteria bacterium GW2011_GWC1_38_13]
MIYMIWIIIIPLVLMVFYVISIYNFFVSSKARIKASIQEIGNQLKRQAELIPNLVTSAKGYLKHEKGIFDKLTEARKSIDRAIESGDVQKMSDAGGKLAEILPGLKVVVESNPEIKGAEVVTKLMEDLRDTSDKVMYARRLLIDLSADYNVKRVSFPSNIIASMFKFEEPTNIRNWWFVLDVEK